MQASFDSPKETNLSFSFMRNLIMSNSYDTNSGLVKSTHCSVHIQGLVSIYSWGKGGCCMGSVIGKE